MRRGSFCSLMPCVLRDVAADKAMPGQAREQLEAYAVDNQMDAEAIDDDAKYSGRRKQMRQTQYDIEIQRER
jgi:hypothetical protein